MSRNILVTGVTGFLGKQVVSRLLTQTEHHIFGVVRSKFSRNFDQRDDLSDLLHERFHLVEGDITTPCILNERTSLPKIHEILHIAALTDFHEEKREELKVCNIQGVENVINLAKQLSIERFVHISTAYVSENGDGPVKSREFDAKRRFRNYYEKSKYHGEMLVRNAGVPYIIIRPSIIIGHSQTGDTDSDKMIYGVIFMYHQIDSMLTRQYRKKAIPETIRYKVPGDPNVTLNLICVDDVARYTIDIFNNGKLGHVYHVCHTDMVSLKHLHDLIARQLDNPDVLSMIPEIAESRDPKQIVINKATEPYRVYMLEQVPEFDTKYIRDVSHKIPLTTLDNGRLEFLIRSYITNLKNLK